MTTTWMSRCLIEGDHLAVCTTEADYYRTLRYLKIPIADWDRWLMQDALATTHYFTTPKGSRVTIVCIPVKPETTASTLQHCWYTKLCMWCRNTSGISVKTIPVVR